MAKLDNLEVRMKKLKGTFPRFIQNRNLNDYTIIFEEIFQQNIIAYIMGKENETNRFHWVDVCCGYGLALRGLTFPFTLELKLTGIDCMKGTNPNLKENIKKYGKANYQWIRADMTEFNLKEKADLISCIGGINYLSKKFGFTKKKLRVIEHLYNQLNSGGILFFSDHGIYNPKSFLETLPGLESCKIVTQAKNYGTNMMALTKVGLKKSNKPLII